MMISLFVTKESPLSNFHDSRFELDDRTFANAELYLTFKKMLMFNNSTTADKIMSISDPKLIKQTARRPRRYDDGRKEAPGTEDGSGG